MTATIRMRRRLLLCCEVATEESLPGSRILLTETDRATITSQQARVVEVGPGEFDEDGDYVPTDPRLRPGAWILHAAHKRKPAWDDAHFLLLEDDVVAVLEVGA